MQALVLLLQIVFIFGAPSHNRETFLPIGLSHPTFYVSQQGHLPSHRDISPDLRPNPKTRCTGVISGYFQGRDPVPIIGCISTLPNGQITRCVLQALRNTPGPYSYPLGCSPTHYKLSPHTYEPPRYYRDTPLCSTNNRRTDGKFAAKRTEK